MRIYMLIFLLVGVAAANTAYRAFDIKQPVTQSQMDCLLKEPDLYTIFIRAYSSVNGGMFDYNVCNTYHLIHGIPPSIYMVPAPKGPKNGYQHFNEMRNGLIDPKCGLKYAPFFWLLVASPHDWNAHPINNTNFIKDVITAARSTGYDLGIYTNANDWHAITNNANHKTLSVYDATLTLWWADAPTKGASPQNLDHFKPFGGWTVDDVKAMQYAKHEMICQVICNQDRFFR